MTDALVAGPDGASRTSTGHPVFDFINGMTHRKFESEMEADLHILKEAGGQEHTLGHPPRDVLAKVHKRGWFGRDEQGKIVLKPNLDCY